MEDLKKISNSEIAKILREIGEYLDMQGAAFKPRAYEKAAEAIEALQEEVADIYKSGQLKALEDISGVGVSIAEKIEELLKTGKSKYYEQLKAETPVNLSELTAVEGLGPKSIKKLYEELAIRDLEDLEKAAKGGKIRGIEGFGAKTEENILKGIRFVKKSKGRFILGFIMPDIRAIESRLKVMKEVKKLATAGSVRRRKETVGDADILVVSDTPKPIMDYFVSMPEVTRVYAHGESKSAVKLKSGLDVDLRVVPEESYGAALNYFTGSKDHNIALREIAIKKGYKLNEYGLFQKTKKGEERIAGITEEEIYRVLGLDYIDPEIREMTGEIEAARNNELPKLVRREDLMGDLQVQTNWSDSENSIEEMAIAAMKLGFEYIAITDHTKRLAMTHGLDEKKMLEQIKEINRVNQKLKESPLSKNKNFRILKGTECDILKDGSLDLPDSVLEKLDVVGASVHSYFNLTKEEQTERIKRAMRNSNVDIIFHPTGRLIQRREPYKVDVGELIKIAKETKTVLEIDAYPDRLDLKDEYIRKCVEVGVKMAIDSDAHSAAHFSFLEYGVAQARRGWAERKDIINAWPLEKMLSMLKPLKGVS